MKHIISLFLLLLPAFLHAQDSPPVEESGPSPRERLELAKEALSKHYEYQKMIGETEAEWTEGKPLLKNRIEVLESAIADMEAKTKEQAAKITETDKARGEVVAEEESLEKVRELQVERIEELERRVRNLSPVLPAILTTKLQAMIDRLPAPNAKPTDINSSVSERYLNVIAILNEAGKFQNELTVVNERRKLGDGRTAEVQTLYFGLSYAVYAGIGATASEAGIGTVDLNGWKWESKPELAPRIAAMIEMIENGASAEYIPLPVTIK